MDQSLLALTSNSTYVSNAAYNTAVLNRQALQEALGFGVLLGHDSGFT